jgi:hypothetical protein
LKYDRMKEEKKKIRKSEKEKQSELMWIEPATSATPPTPPTLTTPNTQTTPTMSHTQTIIDHHSLLTLIPLKNPWITSYSFCSMKYLPDGIHTVHACCIFDNMKYGIWNMKYEIWNMKYEIWYMTYDIWKYDRMKEVKMKVRKAKHSWVDMNRTRDLCHTFHTSHTDHTSHTAHTSHTSHTDHHRPPQTITDLHSLLTLILLKKSRDRLIYILFCETSSWRNSYGSRMLDVLKIG